MPLIAPGHAALLAALLAGVPSGCAPAPSAKRPRDARSSVLADPLAKALSRARRGRLRREALRDLAGRLWARAREYEQLGALAAARDAARHARRLDGEAGRAKPRQAQLLKRLTRTRAPRPTAAPGTPSRCAAAPHPAPRSTPLGRALGAAARGRLKEALKRLGRAPASAAVRRWQARLLVLTGRRRQALARLGELRRLSPGHVLHLPSLLADLVTLGFLREAEALARTELDAGARDPALLRPIARALIAAGRPEATRIAVDRWAHAESHPARAYTDAMAQWAAQGNGPQTAHWAGVLLQWRRPGDGDTLRHVVQALRRAGRAADARRIVAWARTLPASAPQRKRLTRTLRSPPTTRMRLPPLAVLRARARHAPVLARVAVGYLAAARAQTRGQATQAAHLLVDALLQDPHRYGRRAWRRLAAAARGHRLSPWIPWAMLGASATWSCPR